MNKADFKTNPAFHQFYMRDQRFVPGDVSCYYMSVTQLISGIKNVILAATIPKVSLQLIMDGKKTPE
jgi:hypothetical protein